MQQQQLQQGGDSTVKQDPLQSVTDPFLGQNPSSDHSRQASTDSGVGKFQFTSNTKYLTVILCHLCVKWRGFLLNS